MLIRKITEPDYEFLMDMMYESIHIPKDKPPKSELLNEPAIKKYNEEWGRKTDRAYLAVDSDGNMLGASWYRLFEENNKGYGFVDSHTPELGIAVRQAARGKGVASSLMAKLIDQARQDGYSALSLSVDPDNTAAIQLYTKFGFVKVGISGTSWTMKLTF
ncbi:GNAT family N-acetyltransferase [Thalassobacillus pellis]|uniref:GNAT family N-acetyltransferase n=1 Tax=Thalassobacillus pellis TaxID=748008 RepID=UPI001960EB77|nr:GNAT family N-acetyltransferase [Thalassobacillus pellis]MBM7554282.1 ribosomal protein S18 acetylase RimI-like enzyme [Thalassobacillus pellis]